MEFSKTFFFTWEDGYIIIENCFFSVKTVSIYSEQRSHFIVQQEKE